MHFKLVRSSTLQQYYSFKKIQNTITVLPQQCCIFNVFFLKKIRVLCEIPCLALLLGMVLWFSPWLVKLWRCILHLMPILAFGKVSKDFFAFLGRVKLALFSQRGFHFPTIKAKQRLQRAQTQPQEFTINPLFSAFADFFVVV